MKQSSQKYPAATVIGYGPDNKTATKLVVAIFTKRGQKEPAAMHKWFVQGGDIRQDPTIMEEVADFINRHHVAHTATYDRIFGCPHEEGIDYPLGSTCPHCPYWANVDRYTGEPKSVAATKPVATASNIGRNDPCPCGSGKKFKKCCGK